MLKIILIVPGSVEIVRQVYADWSAVIFDRLSTVVSMSASETKYLFITFIDTHNASFQLSIGHLGAIVRIEGAMFFL